MIVINTNDEGRVIGAAMNGHIGNGEMKVVLPNGIKFEDLPDYKYVDGEFVYDPLPKVEPIVVPTEAERFEAQLLYTAMMTNTLL